MCCVFPACFALNESTFSITKVNSIFLCLRIHAITTTDVRFISFLPPYTQYIYITLDEMHAVAQRLTKRGRMSISDLAAQSSSLIDLEPRATGTAGAGKKQMIDFDELAEE